MSKNTTPAAKPDLWKILGLNASETLIMKALTKMARSPVHVALHTGIPLTTVCYSLTKLHKRDFVVKMKPVVGTDEKKVWKSNLPKIIRYLRSLPPPKPGEY